MDGAHIQRLIDRGLAIAARHIGTPYDLYRPIGIDNPLQDSNRIDTLQASFNIGGKYAGQSKANQLYWQVIAGGQEIPPLVIGDYLIGDATYVIVARDQLLPPIAVRCTGVMSFSRVVEDTSVGRREYQAPVPQVPYASGIPVATAIKRESGKPTADLPADASLRGFYAAFFYLPPGTVRTRDTVADEMGRKFQVTAVDVGLFGTEALLEQTEM